jgi:hypothetical protein
MEEGELMDKIHSSITINSNSHVGQELITQVVTEALDSAGFTNVELLLSSPKHAWINGDEVPSLMDNLLERNPSFFGSKVEVIAGYNTAVPDVPPDNPNWKPAARHPIQPVVLDEHGTARFKENSIVRWLATNKLNELGNMEFPREDREQLAQLIGYSVSGFGELSYASDGIIAKADKAVEDLFVGAAIDITPQVPLLPAPKDYSTLMDAAANPTSEGVKRFKEEVQRLTTLTS